MAITIDLAPELEAWLAVEATRRGQGTPELARALLETTIAGLAKQSDRPTLPGGVQRRSPDELIALARRQGVLPASPRTPPSRTAVDDEFDVDAFLEARREWQREGRPGFPFDDAEENPGDGGQG